MHVSINMTNPSLQDGKLEPCTPTSALHDGPTYILLVFFSFYNVNEIPGSERELFILVGCHNRNWMSFCVKDKFCQWDNVAVAKQ